ncbi:MAG: hypothetical protein H7A33_05210 [Deltaproteobacteria bacterium]|nr:hypothetical protein [Deltaproteobacteria bacterium]
MRSKSIWKMLKNARGFSVIESILTTTVVGVGLFSGLIAMQNSVIHSVDSDLNTVATELAQQKLDDILMDNVHHGYDYLTVGNYPAENLNGQFSGFTREVLIYEVSPDDLVSPSEGSGMQRVDIEVTWGNQNYQKVKMSTVISDYS